MSSTTIRWSRVLRGTHALARSEANRVCVCVSFHSILLAIYKTLLTINNFMCSHNGQLDLDLSINLPRSLPFLRRHCCIAESNNYHVCDIFVQWRNRTKHEYWYPFSRLEFDFSVSDRGEIHAWFLIELYGASMPR